MMRRAIALLVLGSVATSCGARVATPPLPPGIAADVAYLSSRTLQGRAAGSAGGDSAAAFIARRHAALGLTPAFPASGCAPPAPCAPSWFQLFRADEATAQNVAAILPGSDSTLRHEYVVVGAHYDHIGRSARYARDWLLGDLIHPGADDNASGTAAVLELARRLTARPLRRSVLFVLFDAEELGLVGSQIFVDRPPVPREAMVLMVNFDMVGRLRPEGLNVDASSAGAALRATVDSAARAEGVPVVYSTAFAGRSDDASFRRAGVPAVSFNTGTHPDYHTATDVAARINVPGIERVVRVAEGVVVAAAGDGRD